MREGFKRVLEDEWTFRLSVGKQMADPEKSSPCGPIYQQRRITALALAVKGDAPLPLQAGDTIEIISNAEIYNRAMEERNWIWAENKDKPWLPIEPDGE